MTITFKISDVNIKTVNANNFNHKKLYSSSNEIMRGNQQPQQERTIIKTSITEKSKSFGNNSFVDSAFEAYCQHHGLIIRPDDIFNAILIQLSLYINAHSEELRNKIVSFQGKKQLLVQASGTLMSAPYDQLLLQMTREIEKNIKDPSIREWVMKRFSTTTDQDQLVSSITLMSTLKNYFEYKMTLMCNLPQVTLEGEVSDYVDIKKRLEKLKDFELPNEKSIEKWLSHLHPVIDKFIETASGSPDKEWWNRIVNHVGGGSGPSYISGWITVFCAFDADGKYIMDNKKEYVPMFGNGETISTQWCFINTNDIPKGFLSCPVLIDDNGTEYNTEFYAGHMAFTLSDDHKSIKPNLDWCIILQ